MNEKCIHCGGEHVVYDHSKPGIVHLVRVCIECNHSEYQIRSN
jgi:ribosomal protein S27E